MSNIPARKDSHRIAINNFDGTRQIIEADEIRFCLPTRQCVQFWVTVIACFASIGIGIFFMVFQGTASAYFFIGEGLLAMAIGVLIPGPDYNAVTSRRNTVRGAPDVEIIIGDESSAHSPTDIEKASPK